MDQRREVARTLGLLLCQLSYPVPCEIGVGLEPTADRLDVVLTAFAGSPRRDSHPRHPPSKGGALLAELLG